MLEGPVEAFTLGKLLKEATAVIHIEKADVEIPSLLAVINQEFCRHSWLKVPFINREQDLSLPGLRTAKMATILPAWRRSSDSTGLAGLF